MSQFSRYARLVRGAARVAGLSARLAWSNQGWVEQFRLPNPSNPNEEAVLGGINLVKVPPVAEIPISRAMEEVLSQRQLPEPLRQAIAKAEGTQVKWIEAELTGPISADLMAALIAVKAELIKAGAVPISHAERPKVVPRPEAEPVRAVSRPVARPVTPAKAARSQKPERTAKPAKAKKPAKAAKPVKAKKPAAKKPAAKSAKSAKRR